MKAAKQLRLEKAGWQVGTVAEMLELSPADAAYIEIRVRLAKAFAQRRAKHGLTQTDIAKLIQSSQSRVAKIESGNDSVSTDLMIRALLATGATSKEVGKALAG